MVHVKRALCAEICCFHSYIQFCIFFSEEFGYSHNSLEKEGSKYMEGALAKTLEVKTQLGFFFQKFSKIIFSWNFENGLLSLLLEFERFRQCPRKTILCLNYFLSSISGYFFSSPKKCTYSKYGTHQSDPFCTCTLVNYQKCRKKVQTRFWIFLYRKPARG